MRLGKERLFVFLVVRKWNWWRGISCHREPPVGASWYRTRLKKTARSAFKAFGCVAAGPRGSFQQRMAAAPPTVWEAGTKNPCSVCVWGWILHSRFLPGNDPGERGFVLRAHPFEQWVSGLWSSGHCESLLGSLYWLVSG